MKVSMPTIRVVAQNSLPHVPPTLEAAVESVKQFVSLGNCAVLTGAGVSTDSGIRAYRNENGRYLNPNFKPIFHADFIEDGPRGHSYRQRYWARSFLGWPRIVSTRPNPSHTALATLMHTSHIQNLITQNVDGLHLDALREPHLHSRVLELHGTLHTVHCRKGHQIPRFDFQRELALMNPVWAALEESFRDSRQKPRTNPDGDVELEGVSFDDFQIPACHECQRDGIVETNMKPLVVYFGGQVADSVKKSSFEIVEKADRLLIVGTTLATYSAYRLVKHALELQRPIMLLTMGPTRADIHPSIDKLEVSSSPVLLQVARELASSRLAIDPALREVLESGVITSVEDV